MKIKIKDIKDILIPVGKAIVAMVLIAFTFLGVAYLVVIKRSNGNNGIEKINTDIASNNRTVNINNDNLNTYINFETKTYGLERVFSNSHMIIVSEIIASGASQLLLYHDIEISFVFNCTMTVGVNENKEIIPFNQDLEVKLDIGGNGVAIKKDLATTFSIKAQSAGASDINLVKYSITRVSGTVELPN